MAKPEIREEDELGELPPLDGESRDQSEGDADYGDLLAGDDEEATLDDATGEDDPLDISDLDLDKVEGGWLGEAGEPEDVDTGDAAVVDFGDDMSPFDEAAATPSPEGARDLEDEPRLGDDDLGFGDAPERGGLDAGDEGPLDPDEEMRESDLPALDADDEGELEDSALIDSAFGSEEPLGLPWAAEPWPRVGAPVALLAATAVACAARGALVVGKSDSGAAELVRVDLEGTCERLPAEGLAAAEVCALAVDRQVVAAVLRGGRLVVSSDAGGSFAPIAGPLGEGIAASDAVFASGRLWVRTRTGGLVVHEVHDEGPSARAPIERCPVPGVAAALTCDTAVGVTVAAVLVVDDAARPTAVIHLAAGISTRRDAIDMPEADSPALFAVHGGHMAYAARQGGLVWRTSGDASKLYEWEGRITALSFVDAAGTLIVSTYSDADDTTTLVRLDAAGSASVAARIGAAPSDPDSDGRVLAMARDEARGVLWVVGGFGVAAFAIS
jgi:hypothetical protein